MQPATLTPTAADARRPNPQAAAYVRALRMDVGQWLPEALTATLPRLNDAAKNGPTPAARADFSEASDALAQNGRPWCRQLERVLQDALSAELEQPQQAAPVLSPFESNDDDGGLSLTLTLMDEDQIDEEIAISRLVQIAEVEADASLRELAALCSGLRGAAGISPESNPMRPSVVAGALRRGVQAFGLRKPVRLALLRELGAAVGKMLPAIYARQLQMLQSWGISPASFTLRTTVGDAAEAASPAQALERLGAGLGAATPGEDPQAAADLMARMLTSLASRFTMSEGTRDLIRRLDAPARRIAQSEPEVWHSLDHPLWQLLDRLVAAGSVHENMAGPGPESLSGPLEQAVRQLEGADRPNADQCQQALEAVDVAVSGLVDLQTDRVATQAGELQERPPKSAIEDDLREQLRQQARAASAPPALEKFLAGAWTEVLTDIAQRQGAESAQMKAHAELVDKFIEASTRAGGKPIAPATLGRLLMLARLAMADAKLTPPRIESELGALQNVLCAPRSASAAKAEEVRAALTPFMPTLPSESATDLGTMDILLPDAPAVPAAPAAAARRPEPSAHLGLHDALTTVQIDFGADDAGASNANAWLDTLEPGTYCRIFLLERWMNAQVIWRSNTRSMFVFKSRHGGCTHSLARRVLEKLRNAGLATTIERGEWVAQVMRELAGAHAPH